jgi:hypothetical protein
MTATIGFERLPRPLAALLGETAPNLVAEANDLDALALYSEPALEAVREHAAEQRRIPHESARGAAASCRPGPDRERTKGAR